MSDLEDWIQGGENTGRPPRNSRCSTCLRFSHFDPDIREFLARRVAGELFLPVYSHTGAKSLQSFLATKGYNMSGMALARHIGICLGLNPRTGRPHA